MMALRDPTLAHVLQLSFAVFLLLGGILGIAVGAGLLLRTQATLRAFGVLNRWVSTRRLMKPLEVPRASGLQVTDARRRWVTALFFILAGGYAALRLGLGVDSARVAAAFGARGALASVGYVLVESLRWILVVFCAAGAVLGVVLIALPRAWPAIESRANHWYSTRQVALAGDRMNLTLDAWVERYPRPAGIAMMGASLLPLAMAVFLLLGRR